MKDEIKEILDYLRNDDWEFGYGDYEKSLFKSEIKMLLNYITNLQQENERLKKALNCKEYFSSTMPEDTEFVILTKNNYDRQQKDIQFELIDYKSRCEKAIEELKTANVDIDSVRLCETIEYAIYILQNGSDSQ